MSFYFVFPPLAEAIYLVHSNYQEIRDNDKKLRYEKIGIIICRSTCCSGHRL
jgi:hypothetical protein